MNETYLKNQVAIKILAESEKTSVEERRIESDKAITLPEGCFVIPMIVLDKPEPIKVRRKV